MRFEIARDELTACLMLLEIDHDLGADRFERDMRRAQRHERHEREKARQSERSMQRRAKFATHFA